MTKITLGQVCIKKTGGKFECRRIPYNTSNHPMHWVIKNRWAKEWKKEVANQVMINRRKFGKLPLKFPRISVLLYAVRPFDTDGSYTACKAIVDGLKRDCTGVIKDDSPKHINLEVKQIKVGHKNEERVEIEFD